MREMKAGRHRNPAGHRTSSQATPAKRLIMRCHACNTDAFAERDHAKARKAELRREAKARGDNRPLTVHRCPENSALWHISHERELAAEHGVS